MLYSDFIEELTGLKDLIVKKVKNVYVASRSFLGLHLNVVLRTELFSGMPLTPRQVLTLFTKIIIRRDLLLGSHNVFSQVKYVLDLVQHYHL